MYWKRAPTPNPNSPLFPSADGLTALSWRPTVEASDSAGFMYATTGCTNITCKWTCRGRIATSNWNGQPIATNCSLGLLKRGNSPSKGTKKKPLQQNFWQGYTMHRWMHLNPIVGIGTGYHLTVG